MKSKQKKLSGKEKAKLNIRIKFYDRLDRYCQRIADNNVPNLIFLSMSKRNSFPEFDEVSMAFNDHFEALEEQVDVEKYPSIDMTYMETVQFLLEASESDLLEIVRQETELNNDGELRKGLTSSSDDYNYQAAYNWAIRILDFKKLSESLMSEKEEPTEYDLTPAIAKPTEIFYYKSKKPPRRRRH